MSDYLDVNSLFKEDLLNWRDLLVGESIHEKVESCVYSHVCTPERELQRKIMAAYLLANTKWCKCLPILFSFGPPGTGKSTFAQLCSYFHDVELLSSTSTYASVRNAIEDTRWLDMEEKSQEADGALLAWDNVSHTTLQNPDLLNVMLGGYKRGSDLINISSLVSGRNISFRCFCAKVMSSVHPLHQQYDLRELKRRFLIIFHEKMDEEASDLISPEDVDWTGIYEEFYHPLYQSEANARLFHQHWLKLKRIPYPSVWDDNRKSLCRDLMATMTTFGGVENPKEAIELFSEYWELFNKKTGKGESELKQFLEQYMEDKEKVLNSDLMTHLDLLVGTKQLLGKPRAKEIVEQMLSLGYIRNLSIWEKAQ